MLSNFGDDNPEGQVMYERAREATDGEPDIHVIPGLADLVGPFEAQRKVIHCEKVRSNGYRSLVEGQTGSGLATWSVCGSGWETTLKGIWWTVLKSVPRGWAICSPMSKNVWHLVRPAGSESGQSNLHPRLLRDELKFLNGLLNSE